jgi:hypothetical protein
VGELDDLEDGEQLLHPMLHSSDLTVFIAFFLHKKVSFFP